VCYSVLQRGKGYGSVLQHFAVAEFKCSLFRGETLFVVVCCSVLKHAAKCCSVLQSVLQRAEACCKVLQCVAEYCSVLQCVVVAVCCIVVKV